MTSAMLSARTYGNLVARLLTALADAAARREAKARQNREMAALHTLPPHLLRDIGYYD